VIIKEGNSFYRSWVSKREDPIIKSRLDIAKMIESPKAMNTISTGRFDLTFKTMVPIYDDKKFIGIFEIITHFNSISEVLKKEDGVESVILVNKKYKKQLDKAITKTFIDDYYVANFDVKPYYLNYLKQHGVDSFFNQYEYYRLDEGSNLFIVMYNIPDIYGYPMGSIVAFKPLDTLEMDDVEYIKSNMIFYIAMIILALTLIGYYLIVSKHTLELDTKVKKRTLELNKEKQYIQTILDTNPSIIVVTKDSEIYSGNKTFLEFFSYKNFEDFKKEHKCISEFFLSIDGKPFEMESKMVDHTQWAIYLTEHIDEDHYVTLEMQDIIYHFSIAALPLNTKGEILLTLQDITDIKKKDKLLYEQSKLASMGEMIGNIAHQWRQPLSIISSAATGMKLQKQFDTLNDQGFYENCDLIDANAQYLSRTINDFRDFIKENREKSYFSLNEEIEKFLNLIDPSIKTHRINLLLQIEDDISLYGFPNELVQCFMNFFNNAKDALKLMPEDERILKLSVKKMDDTVQIIFKDSGGGIDESIIDKIFEPYFTTKHQTIGTGLGLHMSYNMIVNGMGGTIDVKNKTFIHNNKKYYGASFTVILTIA
jgi:signal transduction histidine kinase